MNRSLIDRLTCPFSGSGFEAVAGPGATASDLEFGLVRSQAGEFPVIGGVLRLLPDQLRDPLVQLVKDGPFDAALRGALEVPALMGGTRLVDHLWTMVAKRARLGPAITTSTPGKRRLYRVVTRPDVRFIEMASGSGADQWTSWQTYRFSMETFQPVYPLAHLACGRRRILDFGCGLGHSSFLMSRLAPDAEMICADYSFTSMFLARRFLVPGASCICLDGNYPLPFAERYFDLVFSTDALQYLTTKIGLAREFRRVMSDNGVIALAHLHNGRDARRTGTALTAAAYDALFAGMRRRLYPEREIVADYVARGILDLERRYDVDEIDQQGGGVSLVGANDDSAFTVRSGLIDVYIDAMRSPSVNPAYRARTTRGTVALERAIGAPYAIERTIDGCRVLPKEEHTGLAIDTAGILASRQAERSALRELVRQFLVLDLPESYV